MIPKKIHVLTRYVEILDAETQLTRALICINPHEKSTEYTDLSQVWHDASEEPKLKAWCIVQIGENAFDTFIMAIDKNGSWVKWSKSVNITRWAYIEDLLPKGGEK